MIIRMLSESKNMSDQDVKAVVKSGQGVELTRKRADLIMAGTRHEFSLETHGNADQRYVIRSYREQPQVLRTESTRECAIPAPVWPW